MFHEKKKVNLCLVENRVEYRRNNDVLSASGSNSHRVGSPHEQVLIPWSDFRLQDDATLH